MWIIGFDKGYQLRFLLWGICSNRNNHLYAAMKEEETENMIVVEEEDAESQMSDSDG